MKENEIADIFSSYKEIKNRIEKKLYSFAKKGKKLSGSDIFNEICFCILTPQSKAETCWRCVKQLSRTKTLTRGTKNQIQKYLNGVRFYKTKSESIVKVRGLLQEIINTLKKEKDAIKIRNYLVKNVKGIGMKEATHFLRNIGRSEDLAILDRHILRKLYKLKIIKNIPKSLTPKQYMEIEKRMQKFADKIGIKVSHLDFVFWYQETKRIFK